MFSWRSALSMQISRTAVLRTWGRGAHQLWGLGWGGDPDPQLRKCPSAAARCWVVGGCNVGAQGEG